MQSRYISSSVNDFSELEKIFTMDLSFPKIRAEYYVRLHSLLETKGTPHYEGFEFIIHDIQTDTKFTLALTGFGLSYFAEKNSTEIQNCINEFNTYLFSEFNNLSECTFEYEHDFGKTILGCKNGEVFEIDEE